jgi:RNA polymerase sigma factor (TIGR02999 family)
MNNVTQIISRIQAGDPNATDELLPLVYDELRMMAATRLAHEKSGQTLQPTALVHEAYLRLVGPNQDQSWNSRGHFFAAAAEAMRRILIDRARDKKRAKRGGQRGKLNLDAIDVAINVPPDELLELNEALEKLTSEYPDCGELVKLRFYAGMTLAEAAAAMGIARRSADRNWAFARAWLHRWLSHER